MSLQTLNFDNAVLRELPGDPSATPGVRQVPGAAWSRVKPTPVASPRVLAVSAEMLAALGLNPDDAHDPAFAHVFGGNTVLRGMDPWAANYGGHQFGHWAGQLGDGRALSLGEVVAAGGTRHELQLKGAGPTPYSRTADGRAVLRSSIREFLCSEAMHHLGIPTTRALSLVGTGDDVVRDMFYDGNARPEPGAVVCRVAPSFLRFGSFELPTSRGETVLLRQMAEFCIWRDYPHLLGGSGDPLPALRARGAFTDGVYADWFREICTRTADMVAGWMRVGFVHGVMNTDNMSILGLTIDYGPYGWVDNYDPDWTPNTTDAQGRRYRFGWQPKIAQWNLMRLADALHPLFDGVEPLQAGLDAYADTYERADRDNIARKLGLSACTDADVERMDALLTLLQDGEVDMTLFFRGLASVSLAAPVLEPIEDAFYDPTKRAAVEPALLDWLQAYRVRVEGDALPAEERIARMQAANPRFVLRNYLAQEVIDRAERGDASGIGELLDVMRRPYDDQPGRERFSARRPDWARQRAGCSMLSCSS
ncbi:MAG TPA: YdiU family protein [Luteimonas sp.]|nr:YdiU family protein [Luteimonas sp.]